MLAFIKLYTRKISSQVGYNVAVLKYNEISKKIK